MRTVSGAVDDGVVMAASCDRPEAFRAVFERHYERVRRYAWARLGTAGEDVAAEAFAVAFARRADYDPTRPDALPWLLGITTNLISRQYRDERRRLRLLAALGGQRPRDHYPIGATSGVAAALGRLARRDRDVLVLYAVAELSYAEIAESLGIAEGTVRSRLHRARRIVQEVMSE
jgi:RNA polymerase sigma-70 factor (ECF subfamily)